MLGSSVPLYVAAAGRWPGRRCPCCRTPMSAKIPKRGQRNPRNMMTVGHDIPVSQGGRDVWIYICCGCNQDQKDRTFRQWAGDLVNGGDPRAEHVVAVAVWLKETQSWKSLQVLPKAPLSLSSSPA